MKIDLDAARAARGEKEPVEVVLGGQTFTLRLPGDIGPFIMAMEGDIKGAVRSMFGDDADAVLKLGLEIDELRQIMEAGLGGPGNSTVSPGSSNDGN